MIKNLSVVALVAILGVIVATIIIFLTGCSTVNRTQVESVRFSGDHSTSSIRGMWHICYETRLKAYPATLPTIHWDHCDCLVDKSRETYKSSDYNKVGQDNLSLFFKVASIECDLKMSMPNEPSKLPIKQL